MVFEWSLSSRTKMDFALPAHVLTDRRTYRSSYQSSFFKAAQNCIFFQTPIATMCHNVYVCACVRLLLERLSNDNSCIGIGMRILPVNKRRSELYMRIRVCVWLCECVCVCMLLLLYIYLLVNTRGLYLLFVLSDEKNKHTHTHIHTHL